MNKTNFKNLVAYYYDYLSNPNTQHTEKSLCQYAMDFCNLECYSFEDIEYYMNENR